MQLQTLRLTADPARLQASERRLNALALRVRGWSPTAPSAPAARVLVEQEVAVAAAQAGLTHLDVHADDEPRRVGPASFVRVQLESDVSGPGLAALMRRLAALRPGYVVERAVSEGQATGRRLRLTLLAPYTLARGA